MVANTLATGHERGQRRARHPTPASASYGLTPRLDLITGIMSVDLEGCQRDGVHYVGSLSLANEGGVCVYDTFADHGGYKTDGRFITALPPKHLHLGVEWSDLSPRNGAQPIREIIAHFIGLAVGRTVVFHDYGADRRMLDASASMCNITIPWASINVRDTQKYLGYWSPNLQQPGPSLRSVAKEFLGIDIQVKAHTSFEDAVVTMQLYKLNQAAIEASHAPAPAPAVATRAIADAEAGEESTQSTHSTSPSPNTPTTETSTSISRSETVSMDGLDYAMSKMQKASGSKAPAEQVTTHTQPEPCSGAGAADGASAIRMAPLPNTEHLLGFIERTGDTVVDLAGTQIKPLGTSSASRSFSWAQVARGNTTK
ncbi:hypothetical protein LTR53_004286 [Teratosphaeriaceae sp. CCFEE 6253]|nr:hypothetical protein LTR53_004286 [Teratosphaeriaceae sp. CCFEE 6253]